MRTIVVGAGVSGLTAARDLARAGHEVLVLEAADRIGGKVHRREVGGVVVDVGAEAMVNRRPEGIGLAADLGLDVVHPATVSSRIWTRGALRPLPRTLLGAPLDLDQLATSGILGAEGLARARDQRVPQAPADDADVSVGDLVAERFGDEVVDRLVEPLLGGVYAGHAREISARAAAPQLLPLLTRPELVPPETPATAGPVFAGIPGGMGRLVERLAEGRDVRTGVTVRELTRTPTGFAVITGPVPAPERFEADAVVLATPATPSARLLREVAPVAADALSAIEYASVVVATFAFRAADLPAGMGEASGFLVPPVDGHRIKAATFSFAKWGWVREAGGDLAVLRTSLGRAGEAPVLQADDAELLAWSLADLHEATGLTARPVDTHVQRWGGGLPQYAVGHLDSVARVQAAIAEVPRLAVCGAAYEGVGIAPCIASGHRAAARVVAL